MTIGKKIKKIRIERGMTQKELAGDKITRNMLSLIESDKASASIETAKYIANRLSIPFQYLMTDEDDLFTFQKIASISKIKDLYKNQQFLSCINEIRMLDQTDDELNYILAECNYRLGREMILNGSLITGGKYLDNALSCAGSTIYNTDHIKAGCILYATVSSNIQAPLLVLDQTDYEKIYKDLVDLEFYKYITQDSDYAYNTEIYQNHINAKNLIKNRRFIDALRVLCNIEEQKSQYKYNSYVVFSIYTDIERCYREIGDYENAYRYANKRFSLLEAFKQ